MTEHTRILEEIWDVESGAVPPQGLDALRELDAEDLYGASLIEWAMLIEYAVATLISLHRGVRGRMNRSPTRTRP